MMTYETGPLTVLARKLTVGPPSLSTLLGYLEQSEGLEEFVRVVREFLPDRETEIMANPLMEQLQAFVEFFAERYFPLHQSAYWVDEDTYSEIVSYIPIQRLGLSWDDYHEIPSSFDPGIQLLTALVASPFEEYGDAGSRVPLLEVCVKHVGQELVQRLPKDGWQPADLHRLLDGTRFEGAALWADIIWHNADSVFFNVTWEDEIYDADWSRETVDYLTQEWPKAMTIQDKVNNLVVWLEEAPAARFKELVEAIMLREDIGAPAPKTLIEVFSEEAS